MPKPSFEMKKFFTPRLLVQISVFAVLVFLSLSHLKYGIEKAASIDAYCPYGAIEGLATKIWSGEYLHRIWTSSFILMGLTVLVTILFGRVFCSHFCPLGALQEWIRSLGRRLGIRKDLELPAAIDRYARYLKYVFLLFIAYYSFHVGDLWFRNYDPYNALMHFGNEFDEKVFAYGFLAIILIGSLFSKSWWCRYFCPFGATLGILRKLSSFEISRDKSTCISCASCHHICPANLPVDKDEVTRSADCISCLSCVSDCPKGSLSAKLFGRKISKRTLALGAALSFFVPLLIFMATPLWQTKAPSNILNTSGAVDYENIRGSNSLGKLVEETGIPLEAFQKELGLPADIDTSLLLKEIGAKYGLSGKDGEPLETEDFREAAKALTEK